ncbi:hypothetical protein CRV03_07410 [Arcobacter sp. F155]|uniref:class I SAM-dependent methyltransferase n=1 Tax=Arcobacter sp. F155 TaxID=2044512 RepID=UPI00100B40E4|nr:class I SAM-dependent methyltransferase [Arcobacter sp. F155]RXJ77083.1 hypothetical protein CRV03_07410 [Arcobacter sp. F155]
MSKKEFWDKAAADFPRYNKENDQFQQKIIEILKNENVINKNTSVLDIGCGTGVYTIPLAKEVKSVLALDISPAMLDILQEDSWNYNVKEKIKADSSGWRDFKSGEKFDLVFATLSAAFSEDVDFEKILEYSNGSVCFLDFVEEKGSNFEELLFHQYGIEKFVFKDLENKKRWLKSKNIKYKKFPLQNTHSELLELDDAILKIKESIKISKKEISPSDEDIVNLLKPITIGSKVNYVLNINLELLLWKSSN